VKRTLGSFLGNMWKEYVYSKLQDPKLEWHVLTIITIVHKVNTRLNLRCKQSLSGEDGGS